MVDNGEIINYNYNPNGTLQSTGYGSNVISFEYDGWGRKTKMIDPSAGTYTYQYNSIGDLLKETTPNGNTVHTYDVTGKIATTSHSGKNIAYNYNVDKLPTNIITNSADGPYVESFTYDSYKRITTKKYTTPVGFTYTYNYTFDNLGRVLTEEKKVTGASGTDIFKTKNIFKNGYLWKLQNASTNTDLKVYNTFNEREQVTNFTLANGLVTDRTYDQYGYLTHNVITKNNVQQFTLSNTWDVQRGNLSARTNSLFTNGINETFQYDTFDRLTNNITKQGTNIIAQETNIYDTKGRITNNNIGDYSYDVAKPYQLSTIENINDLGYYQANPLQVVTYNERKAPLTIKQQGKENIFFNYDGFDRRTAMFYGNEAADYTASSKIRYYSPIGDIEVDFDKTTNKYIVNMFVDGDAYSANILQRKENNNNALYYLHRDYLGSILAITNNVGAIVEKRHFDAWGNVLLVRNGQNNNPGKLTFVERGYTGHEHLQEVGLINMNARLYDPKLHRFLAPDNFVQEPNNSQNYNRYGYALNNPLKYTDPSGEFLVGFISGLIKGIVNGGNVWRTGIDTGVNEMKITWGLFKTDPNKTFAGQVWEVVSRFTWQSPQVLVGNIYSNVSNWGGQVDNVDYKYGATVISGNNWGSGGAVTLGNFIIGDHDLVADPNNSLFQHEYGHYLQSQAMGPAYLQRVGFPSLIDKGDHDFHPVEQDANRRAFKYFSKEVNGFYQTQDQYRENVRNGIRRGWDFWRNPLNVDGSNQRDQYVDYRNAEHMRLLSNLVVRSMWYDYLDTFIPAGINTSFYNNR